MRRMALNAALVSVVAIAGASPSLASASPVVTSITPNSGSVVGGELVTINGAGFRGLGGICAGAYDMWFGTDQQYGYGIRPLAYLVLSDNQIRTVVPPNLGGAVDVQVHNLCGTSRANVGDKFTYLYPDGQCLRGECQASVSSTEVGALRHVGDGLLNGFRGLAGRPSSKLQSLIDALSPRQWRLGDLRKLYRYCPACRRKTATSLDLTSDWRNYAASSPRDRRYIDKPYEDLARYRDFITRDVRRRMGTPGQPTYYDVWNEPSTGGTIRQWLSVYDTAYFAVKAADRGAQVVGPSISTFLTTSPGRLDTPGYQVDLTDFLDSELRSGARFAAISWHEDGGSVPAIPYSSPGDGIPLQPNPGGLRDEWSPSAIGNHVAQARALLARYPPLAATKIFVNEYGPPYAENIPGWMVGDFAAFEASSANAGMLSCPRQVACSNLFDGLIGYDGKPQMPYWVLRAYAQMQGRRLATTSVGANVYVLGAYRRRARVLEILVGRGDDCWGEFQCPQFHTNPGSAIFVPLTAAIPWRGSTVTVVASRFSNSASNAIGHNDVPCAPATVVSSRARVVGGKIIVPLRSVHNGDAFSLTVTPASTSPATRGC